MATLSTKRKSVQTVITPSRIVKKDGKEAFLNKITERSESKVLIDDVDVIITGLPFFK